MLWKCTHIALDKFIIVIDDLSKSKKKKDSQKDLQMEKIDVDVESTW